MRTIEIEESLLEEAKQLSGVESDEELVRQTLERLIRHLRQQDMLSLFGKVEWDGDLNEMRTTL